MMFSISIGEKQRSKEEKIINVLLTLATGVLTLLFPNFLYLIAGGYLLALGLMFMAFKFPGAVAALPIVAGGLIFVFPDLIPYTFAGFLGFFGLLMLFSFQLSFLGIIIFIIAVLIVMNPDSVAYFIAFFMLTYAVSNLIQFYKQWKNKGPKETSDGEIIIE
ncbi:MAG TPA: hypothetical protein VFM80_06415 [Gracilimonas sp.]|uniref:hypothetical protein n=1 Tax=Gracilimonas sp. TaxID=1974203 RepID=UPI002D9BEC4C|nr:hypothetical protein [Gracilimonas sp.]